MSRQKPIIQIDAKKQRELAIDSEMGVDKAEDYILEHTEVRPTVYWHAKRMEKRLREKDIERGKDGWHDGRFYFYIHEIRKCYNKIVNILLLRDVTKLKENEIYLAIKKCIDGSNFYMMLADNLRDELAKRGIKQDVKK